ncbi:MAG: hypothetical protein L6Q77_01475 [Bacteroidetes bacterium]|nr:hypothetical protein [Bacteroidota bacterium]
MNNPVADILPDDLFLKLRTLGLINEKGIRDLEIKKRFRELRTQMAASEVIESLRNEYPYLQYDTIRKIVYQTRPRSSKF